MTKPIINDMKSLHFGGAQHVVSSRLQHMVNAAIQAASSNECLTNKHIHQDFCASYLKWISATKSNSWHGLEQFPVMSFSNGTTESFDKFYLKNIGSRLRFFRGEYMYHQVAARRYFKQSCFIEDQPLSKDDAVVISFPFSDTGNEHDLMRSVLQQCTALQIPVLLDCSYFGVCSGLQFDLDHDCITDVTFSLSKCFPVPNLRIGMRLSRTDDDDLLLVLNKTGYVNRLACAVGLDLIKIYHADYIWQTYQTAQKQICDTLQVSPSHCVIFGIDSHLRYPEYNRGGNTNRLCLSKYLEAPDSLPPHENTSRGNYGL